MNLSGPEFRNIRTTWLPIQDAQLIGAGDKFSENFKVYNRHNEQVHVGQWSFFYKDPHSTCMAFKLQKDYWANGRKMRIETSFKDVQSGEYVVTWKAKSNSYDKDDFVVVEYYAPTLVTPKQALSWLEHQIALAEAKDGITTEQIINGMKVR